MERIIIENNHEEVVKNTPNQEKVVEYTIEVPNQRWEEIKNDIQKIEEIQKKIADLEIDMDKKPPESSVNNVVSAKTREEKQEVIDYMEQLYKNQNKTEGETQKSVEQLKLIDLANNETNKILLKYGLDPFTVAYQNIHTIDQDHWTGNEDSAGNFQLHTQSINLINKETSLSAFLIRTFHEMLHLKSYNEVRVDEKTQQYANNKTGLFTAGVLNQRFFRNLNEAVTESMTKKYGKTLLENNLLEEEQKTRNDVLARTKKTNLDETYFIKKTESNKPIDRFKRVIGIETEPNFKLESFAYKKERLVLETLVKKIQRKNQERTEDEVMEIFEKAMLSGNTAPLEKTIDQSFGKGTWKKIGEQGENTPSLTEYINSL